MNPNISKLTCLSSKWKASFTTLFLIIASLSTNADAMNVLASSDFDNGVDDFDGWTAHECGNFGLCPIPVAGIGGDLGPETPGGTTFFHETDQGNPGGNLHATDPAPGSTVLFNAPGKFLSNLTQGTTLSFDMFIDGTEYDDPGLGIPLFYVYNDSDIMLYAVDEADAPLGQWLSFSIDIQPNAAAASGPGSWLTLSGSGTPIDGDAAFNNIFGNGGLATELRFWGELTKDKPEGVDGVLLDNVVITAPVPVPAALPLMLSALAGIGFARRRAKT